MGGNALMQNIIFSSWSKNEVRALKQQEMEVIFWLQKGPDTI